MIRRLIVPFVFLFLSCERIIDINHDKVEQELVVSAILHTEGTDSLLLSSTYSTEGTASCFEESQLGTSVSGATIAVISQGDTMGQYVEKNEGCYYYEGERFQENKQYSVSIKHPDFQEVSANTTVPVTPELGLATYPVNGEKFREITEADLQVLLEFNDSENTNDFYMISATSTSEIIIRDYFNTEVIDTIIIDLARINSKSSIIELYYNGSSYQFAQNSINWESYYSVREDELIFSDKLFNGQKISIPVDLRLFELRNTIFVHLSLTAISEEYYQLLRSLAAYDKSERGIFPEALQLYSNVNNGQGIWAQNRQKQLRLMFLNLILAMIN